MALAPMAAGSAPGTAADRGVERQLADGRIALDGVGRDGAHGHHHGERNRQIEVAALLGQVGGGQVDRDVLEGQAQADGVQRIAHALAALGHGLVGQADDGQHVLARADAHLHLDRPRLDADEGDGRDLAVHSAPLGCFGANPRCSHNLIGAGAERSRTN